ncbi:hypothetical protein [Paludisphaera mucosa]|uniref:Uncharacterized protein n=1 Tax=Paludisphaera mucosa TaxID=3030827 RepID=A0ABT6FGW8_9BACT|nr:hypothetical protein [Paludisphaera mucosa]MDG3006819.1 hypothetical protein [Paludisphaera mucosa]
MPMDRPTPPPTPRRRPRFAPRCERLELRTVLSGPSAVGGAALNFGGSSGLSFNASTAAALAGVDVSVFPLRYQKFTARFQGNYLTAPARLDGFSTMLYMNGGGMGSMFLHGNIQIAYYTPTDATQPAVGRSLILPKSAIQSGSQLVLDLQAVPGALDKSGRPTTFTWTVDPASSAQYTASQGAGTVELVYTPSTRGPRGGGSGRLGVIISGQIGLTGTDDPLRGK